MPHVQDYCRTAVGKEKLLKTGRALEDSWGTFDDLSDADAGLFATRSQQRLLIVAYSGSSSCYQSPGFERIR